MGLQLKVRVFARSIHSPLQGWVVVLPDSQDVVLVWHGWPLQSLFEVQPPQHFLLICS
ncbi:MAG: hypothetical protein U5L00_19150 [Desulfovermiculus sp.]|nr:hypothetical protein [Desulfovermiculus sp.]